MKAVVILTIFAVLYFIHETEGGNRRPLFNGSIFGKRGNIEYDPTGKALSALCEIAANTCSAWYQAVMENK